MNKILLRPRSKNSTDESIVFTHKNDCDKTECVTYLTLTVLVDLNGARVHVNLAFLNVVVTFAAFKD